ncbi:MAG TPA: hypothetical protein VFP34_00165, partial [Microlunatus sp.]|nr:hypothetical protein [Microlunatus sp.]
MTVSDVVLVDPWFLVKHLSCRGWPSDDALARIGSQVTVDDDVVYGLLCCRVLPVSVEPVADQRRLLRTG